MMVHRIKLFGLIMLVLLGVFTLLVLLSPCDITSHNLGNRTFKTSLPRLAAYHFVTGLNSFSFPTIFTSVNDFCVVAVGPDGGEYLMPNDFNKLLQHEHIVAHSEEEAVDMASLYVQSTEVYGNVIVISNLSDIPGVGDRPPDAPIDITPPRVSRFKDGYEIHLFLWRELGGVVKEMSITLIPESVSVEEQTRAITVGDYTGFR